MSSQAGRAATWMLAVLLLSVFVLWTRGVKTSASCHAVENDDGTTTYFQDQNVSFSENFFSWSDNSEVVAHEDGCNGNKVQDYGPQNLTLKYCSENIEFKLDINRKPISCPHNCTRQSISKSPVDPAVAGAAFAGVLLVVVVIIVRWKWKELKEYFRRCRTTVADVEYI